VNRLILLVLSVFILSNCGDVGIALNISREQPVSTHFEESIDSVVLIMNNLTEFSLDEVDAFNEYLPKLNDLGSISFNHFAYSIDSISSLESNVQVNTFEIKMINGADTLSVFNEPNWSLSNRDKAIVPISDQDISTIQQWLFDRDTLVTSIYFEMSDFPTGLDRIDFEFTSYFDATLRARNISP
jgi:hypothetical protein